MKKKWTSEGHKINEIETLDLYLKPEEYAVYYVINGSTTGKVFM